MAAFDHLFRPELADLSAYQVLPSAGMVKLDAMENPFTLPDEALLGLAQHLKHESINRYPDPAQEAFKSLLIEHGLASPRHALLLGNGSDEIIQTLHLSLRPGSTVMAFNPSFSMYALNARLLGLRYVEVPLCADFTLPTAPVLAALAAEKPALLWIAYPNNPTGNTFALDDLQTIVEAHQGLTIIDEAYLPFTGGMTLIDWLDRYPQVLVMRTLSKLGLAGLRLGYLMGDANLILMLDKIRLPFNTNRLSVAAASFVISHYHHFLIEQATQIAQARDAMTDWMQKLSHQFPWLHVEVFPSKANFLLIRCDHAGELFQWLLQHKILIKNLSKASPLLHQCLRFTLGTPEENQAVQQAVYAFAENFMDDKTQIN